MWQQLQVMLTSSVLQTRRKSYRRPCVLDSKLFHTVSEPLMPLKKRKVVDAVPKVVTTVMPKSSVKKMALPGARESLPNDENSVISQLEINAVPEIPSTVPFGTEEGDNNFLVDKNGRSVAITITQQDGGLKTSLVPIATKVVKGEHCSDEKALGKKDNLVGGIEKSAEYLSNRHKWEQLEYEMYLCKDLLHKYVKEKTYGVDFDQKIGEFTRTKKSQVLAGTITCAVALKAIFDHMRGLLDLHIAMARARNEWEKFDQVLLYKALDMMDTVQSETFESKYYGAGDEDDGTDGSGFDMEESDSWSGSDIFGDCDSTSSSSELTTTEEDLKDNDNNQQKLQSIGFVYSAEDFGDAEYSSGNDSKNCNETKKAVQAHLEQKTFSRLLKKFDLGLTLLPESLRQKSFGYVLESRKAIDDCGYTAEAAIAALQEKIGGLRTNAELRRVFTAATFESDLDG